MTDLEVHDYVDKMNAELMEKTHHNYQTAVEALMIALVANLRTISMNDPGTFEYNAESFMEHLTELIQETQNTIEHDQPSLTRQ